MRTGSLLAGTAALIGDPARANMLAALLDGRALTAGELGHVAGVTAATASGHLGKLSEGGLLRVTRQGRHRYYALASPEVARMLDGIMTVAADADPRPRATPRVPPALAECRTCYDHMAGRVAVAIADALVARGAIVLDADAGMVTDAGAAFFRTIGLDVATPLGRRPFCRPCLDWSERRPHLAGVLGKALLDFVVERDWVRRLKDSRAVTVTQEGRQGLADVFGVEARQASAAPSRHADLRNATIPSRTR